MRAVVQRVLTASVSVDGEVIGAIDPGAGQGLVALIGVTHSDDAAKAHALAAKVWRMRILDGEKSAADCDAPLLLVSQFTLYADTTKGRRPSWNQAAPAAVAATLVEAMVAKLRELGATVATGRFGADMRVSLVNDGPVTIIVDV